MPTFALCVLALVLPAMPLAQPASTLLELVPSGQPAGKARLPDPPRELSMQHRLLLGAAGAAVLVIEVQRDDWTDLVSERVMLNKASMSKFSVHLGEVTPSFTKDCSGRT